MLYFAAAWLAAMVDRALEAADIGRHALLVHLLDLGDADLDLGLAVAQQRVELGAAHRLDAARLVHVLDRHGAAEPALLAVVGDEAGHRMDQADLHGRRLRAHDRRKAQAPASAVVPATKPRRETLFFHVKPLLDSLTTTLR